MPGLHLRSQLRIDRRPFERPYIAKNPTRPSTRRINSIDGLASAHHHSRRAYATLGARLRELRWKNSAWLATADTIAGWNGFEIRNAGSGRSPVRKRSG